MGDSGALGKRFSMSMFIGILALVLVSTLLDGNELRWMREHWEWFNRPMGWIERAHSAVNLVHAILFALLGGSARMAFPSWSAVRLAASLAVFGIATELVQAFIPGRHPRIADLIVDVAAGMLGWFVLRALSSSKP